jgi:hypothetical protein
MPGTRPGKTIMLILHHLNASQHLGYLKGPRRPRQASPQSCYAHTFHPIYQLISILQSFAAGAGSPNANR